MQFKAKVSGSYASRGVV